MLGSCAAGPNIRGSARNASDSPRSHDALRAAAPSDASPEGAALDRDYRPGLIAHDLCGRKQSVALYVGCQLSGERLHGPDDVKIAFRQNHVFHDVHRIDNCASRNDTIEGLFLARKKMLGISKDIERAQSGELPETGIGGTCGNPKCSNVLPSKRHRYCCEKCCRQARRDIFNDKGLCHQCVKRMAIPGKTLCLTCREKSLERQRKRRSGGSFTGGAF